MTIGINLSLMQQARLPGIEWLMSMWLLALAYAGLLRRKKAYQARRALLPGRETMIFQPELAVLIGLEEAIILQKIYEWMEFNRSENSLSHFLEERWWTYNSYRDWQMINFPWMKWQTLKSKFRRLEMRGLLIGKPMRRGDATKWYTLADHALDFNGGDSNSTQGGLNFHLPPIKKQSGGDKKPPLTNRESQKKNKRGSKSPWGGASEKLSAIAAGIDGADYSAAREQPDETPPATGIAAEGSAFAEFWQAAKWQMELLFDRASFDTWLRTAEFESYAGGVLIIRVQSEYAQQACQHRLYRNIMRITGNIPQFGELVAIRFVVREEHRYEICTRNNGSAGTNEGGNHEVAKARGREKRQHF